MSSFRKPKDRVNVRMQMCECANVRMCGCANVRMGVFALVRCKKSRAVHGGDQIGNIVVYGLINGPDAKICVMVKNSSQLSVRCRFHEAVQLSFN